MTLQSKNSPRHVYLADDDEDDRILFMEALQEVNNSIILTQAKDGKQLMDILYNPSTHLPEIIFLDINMPKQNGFECLEEIRKINGSLKDTRIIMLSTSKDPSEVDKALALGATFYASKPCSFNGLKSLIKEALEIDWFFQDGIIEILDWI